jgi:hypothetical protein
MGAQAAGFKEITNIPPRQASPDTPPEEGNYLRRLIPLLCRSAPSGVGWFLSFPSFGGVPRQGRGGLFLSRRSGGGVVWPS